MSLDVGVEGTNTDAQQCRKFVRCQVGHEMHRSSCDFMSSAQALYLPVPSINAQYCVEPQRYLQSSRQALTRSVESSVVAGS